jgi:hypothetical protein
MGRGGGGGGMAGGEEGVLEEMECEPGLFPGGEL